MTKHSLMMSVLAVALVLPLATSCFKLPTTTHTVVKAKVLKVYSVTDAGYSAISYVVDRGGVEIVVSDPMGKSSHKVGDTIEYLDQKMDMSGMKMLTFTYLK